MLQKHKLAVQHSLVKRESDIINDSQIPHENSNVTMASLPSLRMKGGSGRKFKYDQPVRNNTVTSRDVDSHIEPSNSLSEGAYIFRIEDGNKTVKNSEYYSVTVKESVIAPGILIEEEYHRPSFYDEVESALSKISKGTSGLKLIDVIQGNMVSEKIMLISYTRESQHAKAFLTPRQEHKHIKLTDEKQKNHMAKLLSRKGLFSKGEGSSVQIFFNPDVGSEINNEGRSILNNDAEKAYLILAHEMIHGMRYLKGTSILYTGTLDDPKSGMTMEEHRTIGIGTRKSPSENTIRMEHGEPLRRLY
jgi:ribosome-binding factor A